MSAIYILYNKFYLSKDGTITGDYFYLSQDIPRTKCRNVFNILKITNIRPEFYCAKPPGLDFDTFFSDCSSIASIHNCKVSTSEFLDSQFFTFEQKLKYLKFTSLNHFNLINCHKSLKTYLLNYYTTKLNKNELKGYDRIFFNQTESPIRFSSNCMSLDKICYFLTAKYNIPSVGTTCINTAELNPYTDEEEISTIYDPNALKNINKIYQIDFENISKLINPADSSSAERLTDKLKILSYDIETYNNKLNTWDEHSDQPIICIGIGIFDMTNSLPQRRVSIITKDFDKSELKDFKYTIKVKNNAKCYNIHDYNPAIIPNQKAKHLNLTTTDEDIVFDIPTEYIVVKSECQLIQQFITFIRNIKPYTITGFNNWNFDDKWIHAKLEIYGLEQEMFKALSMYTIDIKNKNYIQPPKYGSINVKLDGEINKNNYQTWTNGFVSFHDAMFSAVKEDPKKFNQRQSRKLNSMLDTYDIKYPYAMAGEGQKLQKTGLDIPTMFRYWANDIHIYQIARYCCQDAWITCVLAIERNMISDLIEMSNITHTTFADSLLKAVNIRVASTLNFYAYQENFAFYDSPDNEARTYKLRSALGNKFYERKTLRGGAVKNKKNGREKFIVALDFSSMYPSQKEGSNVDTSSRVDDYIIQHPEEFGLQLLNSYFQEDMYCERRFLTFKSISTGKIYYVEENFAEYKLDARLVKDLRENYKNAELDLQRNVIIDQFQNAIHPFEVEYAKKNNMSTHEALIYLLTNDYKMPFSVTIPMYFCQSPKDPNTLLPTTHFALKEKMLSDFRAKRKVVKGLMGKTKNPTVIKQLSAKEKAIKVVMNSEYGQTGSDLFAYFDPDIGAAVTFASRHCIQELTSCLETEHFYTTEAYLENKYLKVLIDEGLATIEKIKYKPNWELTMEGSQRTKDRWAEITKLTKPECNEFNSPYFSNIDWYLPPRRITTWAEYEYLKQEFLKYGSIEHCDIYRITLPKSELVYQDTDSNYYTNNTIVNHYSMINPTTVNQIMTLLMTHNNLLSNLIPDIIHRTPIGVGFEGAFIVARYLNKKKKYFGKKWNDHMTDYLVIPRSFDYKLNDYESSNIIEPPKNKPQNFNYIKYDWKHLPKDYDDFLNQKSGDSIGNYNTYYTTIPYSDGSYLNTDLEFIGEQDFLEYVNKNGIKCTGVDLARRDQFKFINYHHLLVFKNDLKYTDSTNKIEILNTVVGGEKFPLKPIILKLLLDFAGYEKIINVTSPNLTDYEQTYINYHQNEIVDNKLKVFYRWAENGNKLPELVYPLEFYQKIKGYKPDKQTEIKYVVARLEDMKDRFPNQSTEIESVRPEFGSKVGYVVISPLNNTFEIDKDDIKSKAFMLDALRKCMSDSEIYENLDMKYYFEKLAKTMCNYLAIEEDPTIANYLDDDWVMNNCSDLLPKEVDKQMDDYIQKAIRNISKTLIKSYYPETVKIKSVIKEKTSSNRQMVNKYILRVTNDQLEDLIGYFNDIVTNNTLEPNLKLLMSHILSKQDLRAYLECEPREFTDILLSCKKHLLNLNRRNLNLFRTQKMIKFDKENYDIINETVSLIDTLTQGIDNEYRTYTDEIRYVKIWLDEIKNDTLYTFSFGCDESDKKHNYDKKSMIVNIKVSSAVCNNNDDLRFLLEDQLGVKTTKTCFKITEPDKILGNLLDLMNLIKRVD